MNANRASRDRTRHCAIYRRVARMECLEDRRLLAGDFQLLKDLDPTPFGQSLAPDNFATIGDVAYFSATALTYGRELWRSDGTAAGTRMVRDINVGSASSSPQLLTPVGDRLYFVVQDGVHDHQQLWTTDGAEDGTRLVKAVSNASGTAAPFTLAAVGDTLFFAVFGFNNRWELWKTEGDEASTQLVKEFMGDFPNQSPKNFAAVGDVLYFSAYDTANDVEIWKSDGSAEGTTRVKDIFPGTAGSNPANLVNFNGVVYFTANDGVHGAELWRSDGTEPGTFMLKDVEDGSEASTPREFLQVGGLLYFIADNDLRRLWRTDGTEAGTFSLNAAADYLVEFDDSLYAFGFGSIHRSDGSPAGTVHVGHYTSPFFGTEEQPIVVGDAIYFVAYDGQSNEVWKTDGTQLGTGLLKNISTTGGGSSNGIILSKAGNRLVFRSPTSQSSSVLWASDGTEAGTAPISATPAGTRGVNLKSFAEFQGATWFLVTSGPAIGLWKTDGTEAGTTRIKNVTVQESPLIAAGSYLYFIASEGQTGNELWRTDGTIEGTIRVKDIRVGFPSTFTFAESDDFAAVGDDLFFVTDFLSRELWVTNGTEAGTSLLKTFAASTSVGRLTNVNGTLAFVGYETSHGSELWTSDGTPAGTIRVSEIASGSDSAFSGVPLSFTVVNNSLYFAARSATEGVELWQWNAVDGVALVKDIRPGVQSSINTFNVDSAIALAGDVLYLAASDAVHGLELWKSDGTEAGTVLVKDIVPGAASSSPRQLTAVENVLYFTAENAAGDVDLWKSDGTEAGTVIVRDFRIDGVIASPENLVEADGRLYFTVPVEGVGDELWTTDGTSAGTVLLRDFTTDAGGSDPRNVFAAGGRLYVTATTSAYGAEIWTADLAQPLPLAGDYDDDRDVDGSDFLAWQRNFGASPVAPGSGADASHDGAVGSEDLRLWSVNFSAQFAMESATLNFATSVPPINEAILADAAAALVQSQQAHAAASESFAEDTSSPAPDRQRITNLTPPAVDAAHALLPVRRGRAPQRSAIAEAIASELLTDSAPLGSGL